MSDDPWKSKLYANPNYTLPMPAPEGWPVSQWDVDWLPLSWTATATGFQSTWRTPTFDLRPDLRSANGAPKIGIPINGAGNCRLYIQVRGLSAANVLDDLTVTSAEYANISFIQVHQAPPPSTPTSPGKPPGTAVNNVVRVTARTDVTSDFMLGTDQPDNIILVYAAIGESTPVHYWAIELVFTKVGGVAGPAISLKASYY